MKFLFEPIERSQFQDDCISNDTPAGWVIFWHTLSNVSTGISGIILQITNKNKLKALNRRIKNIASQTRVRGP